MHCGNLIIKTELYKYEEEKKTSDTYSHKGTLVLIHQQTEYLMLNTTTARENG
jgi:hypothetical protein